MPTNYSQERFIKSVNQFIKANPELASHWGLTDKAKPLELDPGGICAGLSLLLLFYGKNAQQLPIGEQRKAIDVFFETIALVSSLPQGKISAKTARTLPSKVIADFIRNTHSYFSSQMQAYNLQWRNSLPIDCPFDELPDLLNYCEIDKQQLIELSIHGHVGVILKLDNFYYFYDPNFSSLPCRVSSARELAPLIEMTFKSLKYTRVVAVLNYYADRSTLERMEFLHFLITLKEFIHKNPHKELQDLLKDYNNGQCSEADFVFLADKILQQSKGQTEFSQFISRAIVDYQTLNPLTGSRVVDYIFEKPWSNYSKLEWGKSVFLEANPIYNNGLNLIACHGSASALYRLLQEENLDPNFSSASLLTTPLFFAIKTNKIISIKLLCNDKRVMVDKMVNDRSALHTAFFKSDCDIDSLEILFQRVIDPNACYLDQTILQLYVFNNPRPHILNFLLEKGADPSFALPRTTSAFENTLTEKDSLSLTILCDHPRTNHLINEKNHGGQTLLHIAVIKRYREGILLLRKKGANPNIEDNDHFTPLILATLSENIEAINALLSPMEQAEPANIHYKTSKGQTALLYALRMNSLPIVKHLLGLGAVPSNMPSEFYTEILMASLIMGQKAEEILFLLLASNLYVDFVSLITLNEVFREDDSSYVWNQQKLNALGNELLSRKDKENQEKGKALLKFESYLFRSPRPSQAANVSQDDTEESLSFRP